MVVRSEQNRGPGVKAKEWLCIGWLIGEMEMMTFIVDIFCTCTS